MILINRILLLGFLAIFVIGFGAKPVLASPVMGATGLPNNHTSALLPIADQLQNLMGTMAPAALPQNKPDDSEESSPDTQETFGIRALNFILADFALLCDQSKNLATNFTASADMPAWLVQQSSDQRHIDRWHSIGHDILIIIGTPLLIAIILDLLCLPLRHMLLRRQPILVIQRLTVLLGLVALKMIPVVFFVGASLMLLDHYEAQKLQRYVILSIIYAVTLNRLVMAAVRIGLTPQSQTLRFIPISNEQAGQIYFWLSAFSFLIIYGYFLTDVARELHVPASVITVFGHFLGFVVVGMAVTLIIQKRALVADGLRGSLSAAQPNLSLLQSLRLWFARSWHRLAIAYLIIGFTITLMDVQNGYNLMLRGTLMTLLVIVSLRFFLLLIERSIQTDSNKKLILHRIFLVFVLRCVAWVIAGLAIAVSWGIDLSAFFTTALGQRLLGASFSIGMTIGFAYLIYEAIHVSSERLLNRRDAEGKPIPASARMRTLLPMLRNTMLIIFAAIVGLVSLSAVGINIAPLLAGAGVVGVAIGFGSQTLVKDFLTGLFIIVENTIAIGDVVKIGDHSGVVETMSLRTLRLRDNDGAMHILPFSEVSQIINMTKDFAFAVIDVGVSYNCDLEQVMVVMRSVGDALQQDPIFKRVILEPIEILGIEKLGDSAITMRARLRTRAGKQWDVKRMFLLKMKQRFDKEGIEIPYPIVTQITQVQQIEKQVP